MSPLRNVVVFVVFLALAGIELSNGFARISSLREGRRQELLDITARGHADVVRGLEQQIEAGRRQLSWLAHSPQLGGPSGPAAATEALTAFFDVFVDLSELALDAADGTQLVRLERAPPAGDPGVQLPLVEPLANGAGRLRARVLLAAPHDTPDAWAPLEGVRCELVAAERGEEAPTPNASGRRTGLGHVFETLVTRDPSLRLVTVLPDAALERAMQPLRREYLWIIGSMFGITLALGLVGAIVLRLSQRAFRLRETEHYLRWIRRMTDRYRALMEGAADMILIADVEGARLREANAAARETLGLALGAAAGAPGAADAAAVPVVAGRHLPSLFGEHDRERFAQAFARAAQGPGPHVAEPGLELRAAGGRALLVDCRLALVDLGDERVVEVSLRDVTRERAMERQLRTSERLGSLGLLTAGVAHEINNPLEGIGNYLSLAERPDLDEAKRRHYLEQVRRGFLRIRDIVQDLLSFARSPVETGRADLARVVDGALGLAAYARDFKGVEIERQGLDAPLLVAGDSRRLEQVVLNLLLNAARAMQGRGRIVLRGARDVRDESGAALVELDVEDDGPGIPPADLERLFDPFFSGHGGTGLGLSVSFGIVQAHGGTLRAANRPAGGAAFTLRLPAAASEEAAAEEAVP